MRIAVYISAQTKLLLLAAALLLSLITFGVLLHPAAAITYGAGSYGTCSYGTCSITLTTSGSIAANVTPAAGATRCSVSKDTVTATTDSSTGYTVTLTDTDTTNTLAGTSSNIIASTGTPASPVVLAANTWGYRVDSIASFGAGPTSAITNAAVPTVTFAAVPLSSGTAGLIRSTTSADGTAVATPVWYGVCANTSLTSGSYSDSVTYTATIN